MSDSFDHEKENIPSLHRQILLYLWSAFLAFTLGYCLLEYYNFQELKRSQQSVDSLYTHPLNVSNAAKEALANVYESKFLLLKIINTDSKKEAIKDLERLFKVFDESIENMIVIHEFVLGEKAQALEFEASRLMIQWHNIGFVIGEAMSISDWQKINSEFYKQKPLVQELEKALISLSQYARDNASLMLEASQEQVKTVQQSLLLRIIVFMVVSGAVFGMILLKVNEILKNAQKTTLNLHRANRLIKESHTILIIRENRARWPLSYASTNVLQLGYDANELLNEGYEGLIHPECLAALTKEVQMHCESGENSFVHVYRIVTKEGAYVWMQDHTTIIRDEQGNVLHFESVLTNIQELKEMELSLKEKDEMMIAQSRHAAMGEMISMIAHQWRQPLAVISMSADNMLLDIEFDDMNAEQFKEGAQGIIAQTQYLSQTIDDFRDYFKPNKELETCLINDVLTEVLGIIGPSLKSYDILLKREFHSTTPIATFPKEFVQVGINLLKNAKEALLDAHIKDPCIEVRTQEDEESVHVSVCDNGPGIAAEIVERIFEPYFSTKDAKEGTGLGLYMSKTIVEKHLLGKIDVVSSSEGTCFKITLPKKRPNRKHTS